MDQTIRAFAVGKGGLPRIAVCWQSLGHDILQLNFTEGTARLLVGQDILQGKHIAGKFLDISLRLVDGG